MMPDHLDNPLIRNSIPQVSRPLPWNGMLLSSEPSEREEYFVDIQHADGSAFSVHARSLDSIRLIDPSTRRPEMIRWRRYSAGWKATIRGYRLFARPVPR